MNQYRLTVTQSLLLINIVVFVVGIMVQRNAYLGIAIPEGGPISIFELLGAHSWYLTFTEGQIWRLITYQFVHANLGHVVFNMWALYFFGPAVEQVFGPKRFLAFYLLCGVAGALFSSVLAGLGFYSSLPTTPDTIALVNYLANFSGYEGTVVPWQMVPLVGASAAIYGIMVAVAFMYPDVRISLLFPPVTMTMRTFALVVIGIATVVILFNGGNAGGEAGHLGGIIMGAVIMLVWKLRGQLR